MPDDTRQAVGPLLNYGPEIEDEVTYLTYEIERHPALAEHYPTRWLALKLLEQDPDLQSKLLEIAGGPAVLTHAQLSLARLHAIYAGEDIEILIADRRYSFIHQVVEQSVHKETHSDLTTSDRLDRIVTHRWLGVPLFLLLMWLVFKLTADVTVPYVDWIDSVLSGPITSWALALLGAMGLGSTWAQSLVVDGLIAGVGGVLVFVPVLMSLYLALAVLEDSGYMARAAFVMDRLMGKIGLHGKSFLPLLVGFGCNVPAIYATRTLTNQKDRILTGLLVPFMSCGARLPVYVLFAAVFFPRQAGAVIFGLYLLGIATAVLLGLVLRKTLFRNGERTVFLMELPPYRVPTLRSVAQQVWQRTSAFLHHAATLILGASLVVWLLMSIPTGGSGQFANVPLEDSAFARAAATLTPALEPLGFGSWEASSALVSGFVAKEVVISTLAQTYGVAEQGDAQRSDGTSLVSDLVGIGRSFLQATLDTLRAVPLMVGIDITGGAQETADSGLMRAIRTSFAASSGGHAAAAGLAFMVFVLLYTPCIATIAAVKHELGTRWMWSGIVGQLAVAWLGAFVVFQIGRLVIG